MTEPLMTLQEVALYMQVHEMTVYKWLKKGVIPGGKVGGRWRFNREVLDNWVKDRIRRQQGDE